MSYLVSNQLHRFFRVILTYYYFLQIDLLQKVIWKVSYEPSNCFSLINILYLSPIEIFFWFMSIIIYLFNYRDFFWWLQTTLCHFEMAEVRNRSIFGLTKTWCETVIPLNLANLECLLADVLFITCYLKTIGKFSFF
jgi:hypothetical protein